MFERSRSAPLRRTLTAAVAAALSLAAPSFAAAETAEVGSIYDVRFAGFPIATGSLSLSIDGSDYRARVSVKASGIAGLFSDERIEAVSSGRLKGARVEPATYTLDEKSGKRQMTVRMGLASGSVKTLDVSPAPKLRRDTVPLDGTHRRGVLDPVSAILMPVKAKSATVDASACARTLPVYDGYTRFDIPLTFTGTRSVDTRAYRGEVAVCSARWVPIAGHRRNKDSVKFMQANRDLEVWLAPVGGTQLFLPYRVSVATRHGTLVIEAREVKVTGPKFTALP